MIPQRAVRPVLAAFLLFLAGCAGVRAARPPLALENVRPPISESSTREVSPITPAGPPALDRDTWSEAETRLRRDIALSRDDYAKFWSPNNLAWIGLGIGGMAAPLAHTSADRSIRDWYQRQVHSKGWDNVAQVANVAGQLWVVWPVAVELMALSGKPGEDYFLDGAMYEWSNRSLRAVTVGFPPVLALYGLLGSSRPDHGDSRWHPFRDFHGLSGHTFMGAVPFLTAAAMTDNPYLKVALFAGSTATGWSRLHKDRHYMSQIALGWWIAYFSVRSVSQTQEEWRSFSVFPVFEGGPGLGVLFRF